jgi:hypothetical protein
MLMGYNRACWDMRTNCADEAAMFCKIGEFKAFEGVR